MKIILRLLAVCIIPLLLTACHDSGNSSASSNTGTPSASFGVTSYFGASTFG